MKSVVPVVVIFCGAAIAWMVLGNTLLYRTADSDIGQAVAARGSGQGIGRRVPRASPGRSFQACEGTDTTDSDTRDARRGGPESPPRVSHTRGARRRA